MNWSNCPHMNGEKILRIYYERRKSNAAQTILFFSKIQKQTFVDVLQNKYSLKFCNIPSKTPVLESLFTKVTRPQSLHVFSCEYCKIFKNTLFYRTPLLAALEHSGSVKEEKNRTAAAISTTYAFFE